MKPATVKSVTLYWPLAVIILIYLVVAAAHSVVVPLTTGNDEWAHFLYTRFIAEHGRLPATTAERKEAGYKSDAPPLYHLLTAAVTAGVKPTRLLRPLTDDVPRRYLTDNIIDSYALVHTAVESPPYRGEVLLWHLGRGVSIFFGIGLIVLTYLTGLEILPTRRLALTAAALTAFIPAVIFHSSVLSYESLSAAVSALFLLIAVKAIKQPERWGYWLALGGLAGLSITVKYSAVLLPLELIFIAWLAGRRVGFIALRLLAAGAALLLAVSWWFGFLAFNFNTVDTQGPVVGVLQPLLVGDASDTTSVELAAWLFGEDALPADSRPPLPRNYPQLLQTLSDSFWAAPVAGQFILSPWLGLFFTLTIVAALVGWGKLWPTLSPGHRRWLLLLTFHALLITPLLVMRILFSYDPREAAQGRHLLLPAASAIAILLVWGWRRWSVWLGPGLVGGLLVWSALGQTAWAARVYPPPIPVWPATAQHAATPGGKPVNITLTDTLHLTAFNGKTTAAGRVFEVTLWWQSGAIAAEDYLIELTLTAPDGQLVGHSAAHPVQGRYPTRAWEPGDRVQDTHYLPLLDVSGGDYPLQLQLLTRTGTPVPGATIDLGLVTLPPGRTTENGCQVWQAGREYRRGANPVRPQSTLTVLTDSPPVLHPIGSAAPDETPWVSAGLFHQFVVGPDWEKTYEAAVNGETCARIFVDAPPRNFTAPTLPGTAQLNLDFNNEIRLLGYNLPARRINPGGRLPLTLYWQALDIVGEDYLIFDNLLDAGQQRWGGYDRRPRDGYSTLRWVPGEIITDAFGVPVDPAAPNGIYTVDIGLYRAVDGVAAPLPVAVEGQPQSQTSVRLGPIKVGGPPPDIVTQNPQPQVSLNQPFGDEITLLGFDVQGSRFNVGPETLNLELVFYWHAERIPAADYTVFLHLRNGANENVAQKDSPPASGRYPTGLWDAGEIIVDEITLPVADVPPGEYTPVVGLYNFVDGARLPVPGIPANEVTLSPIQIANSN